MNFQEKKVHLKEILDPDRVLCITFLDSQGYGAHLLLRGILVEKLKSTVLNISDASQIGFLL